MKRKTLENKLKKYGYTQIHEGLFNKKIYLDLTVDISTVHNPYMIVIYNSNTQEQISGNSYKNLSDLNRAVDNLKNKGY